METNIQPKYTLLGGIQGFIPTWHTVQREINKWKQQNKQMKQQEQMSCWEEKCCNLSSQCCSTLHFDSCGQK